MAAPQPNQTSDLQLCRYCYGTIVSLPGTCSNCHHYWWRDERGTLRCRFGEQANPVPTQQSQAVDPVIQQQLLLRAQSRIDMSLNVPSTLPQGQLSAATSPTALLNPPRPGPPTARTFAAKPQPSNPMASQQPQALPTTTKEQFDQYCQLRSFILPKVSPTSHHAQSSAAEPSIVPLKESRLGPPTTRAYAAKPQVSNPMASQQPQALPTTTTEQFDQYCQLRSFILPKVSPTSHHDQLSASTSPTAILNQPHPGPPTNRASAANPQLSARNMKPPQTMTKPPPSPFRPSALASSANLRSSGLPTPRVPASFNMPAIRRQDAPAPRSQAMPDSKSVPIIKIDTYPSTTTPVPQKDCDASEMVQLDNGTSSAVATQTPKSGQVGSSFGRYGRAELLNVYADINRKLFMTSSLSEGFWKQTQSLGILHPNSYFFRDLHAKLHGPLLD